MSREEDGGAPPTAPGDAPPAAAGEQAAAPAEERPAGLSERTRREALRLRQTRQPLGFAGKVAGAFLDSKLTPLLVVASLLLGGFAVLVTPREEEPQIKVPMVDVFVQLPGATADEVERRVISPLEKALFEIPGVEHVYSTSQPSGGLIIVRYLVGTDPDRAALAVHTKLAERAGELPPGAPPPLVVPRGIDDVPALAYTLWSTTASPLELRQVADELRAELVRHPQVAQVQVLGGVRRAVNVRFDRERLAAHQVSILQVYQALAGLDWKLPAGSFAAGDVETEVEVGSSLPLRRRGRRSGGRRLCRRRAAGPSTCATSPTVSDGADEPEPVRLDHRRRRRRREAPAARASTCRR